MAKSKGWRAWLYPAVLTGSLFPLALMLYRAVTGTLGPEPVAIALNQLGLLGLIFLVASLACTPLKVLFDWNWPIALRKTLGLLGFFHIALHFITYAAIDQGLDFGAILKDILERKFIFIGFLAFLMLIPLAITSTSGMLKRMGFAKWKRLHRLAYGVGILGVIHFILRVKKDISEPAVYGAILVVLFAVRIGNYIRERRVKT